MKTYFRDHISNLTAQTHHRSSQVHMIASTDLDTSSIYNISRLSKSLNFDGRRGTTHHSQCLASIRKLGNRRSSEGLRSFKPSKGKNLFILIILAGDIEMNPGPRFQCGLCKKYCKASDRLIECEECEKRFHASCSNLGDDELLRNESGDEA